MQNSHQLVFHKEKAPGETLSYWQKQTESSASEASAIYIST